MKSKSKRRIRYFIDHGKYELEIGYIDCGDKMSTYIEYDMIPYLVKNMLREYKWYVEENKQKLELKKSELNSEIIVMGEIEKILRDYR